MRYYLLTLGCPKNVADSEGMEALLQQAGHRPAPHPGRAQVLIVNTCGFLEAAQEESISALRALARHKRSDQILIAAGCLAQRDPQTLIRRIPGLDGLLGTRRWMDIVALVEQLRADGRREFGRVEMLGDSPQAWDGAMPRAGVRGGSAYLKISDGCSAPCSFCTIPSFKGKMRSRPASAIVAEARALVDQGAREIILVAQDTTAYGRDLGLRDGLPGLIEEILAACPDLPWLRLMYAYPGHVSRRLIEVMATHPQVCHYLDIPLQHGHPDTLRRMRRPANVDKVLSTIEELRAAMPDIALRTTFIVGFPGETEEEFEALLDFVAAISFDKVGVFTYSAEPGTPAAKMPGQVPARVKEERRARVMELQQRISLARNRAQLGRELAVLIEGVDNGLSLGRSYRDAPEVDGLVIVSSPLPVGEIAPVKITGAMEYDLMGEPVETASAPIGINDGEGKRS